MEAGLFEGVAQWEFRHAALGRAAKLPIFYYDNTAMTAVFTASTAKIRRVLPRKEMFPIEVWPGRCLVAFSAFEYRKTDIDPYNEFSISILLSWDRRPRLGRDLVGGLVKGAFTAYVWHLPVTTEIARAGGVELYGYPKFLADITFDRAPDRLGCTVAEDGSRILTLRGRRLTTGRGRELRYRTWSVKDGVPLVANVVTRPLEAAVSLRPDAASLELGADHPIARALREVDLGRRSLLYWYMPRTEMILFAPRNRVDA